MRLFLRIPFLVLVLIITTGKAAYAENNFRVESLPKAVKQGNVCLIRALGPTPLKSIHGEFQGKRFPMALSEQSGAYEGFLGIDLSTRPAKYKIKVVAIDEKSRVYSSTLSLKVERVHFGVQNLSLPSSMVDLDAKTLERVNREESQLEAVFRGFRDEKLWRGAFILPVEGELSTTFGLNRMINGQRRGPHTGIDLRAEEGAPVLACNSAVVVLFDELFFSGKSLILDHGWGLYSMYFHLSEALVKEGDRVSTGTLMGRVGATGRSTGPHLHWGIRMNGARVDPLSLIRETSRF